MVVHIHNFLELGKVRRRVRSSKRPDCIVCLYFRSQNRAAQIVYACLHAVGNSENIPEFLYDITLKHFKLLLENL